MSEEKLEAKMLALPNDTKVLSKVSSIGEALEEMTLHNRGTARRLVLKDRIIELLAEATQAAYEAGLRCIVEASRPSLVDEEEL